MAEGTECLAREIRASLVGDWVVREEIERGQEMERLIGPESVGEAEGPRLRGFIGDFQCTRPGKKKVGEGIK